MPSDDAKGVENTENDDAKCVLGMEPFVMQPDGEGQDIAYTLIDGMHFLNVPWIKQRLAALPDLPIQDKDVLIPAFPKSGTHWMWEICTMIRRMKAAPTNGGKMEGFIEFIPQEALADYASPRMINTHLLPERLPKQILEKKTKLIMMLRNPKDVAVSFYHHTKSIPPYGYSNGTFKGYFEVFINGNNDFGSWFDYTLAWDKFLQTYPKDRQLVLYYEDVKEDLLKYVKVIARFLNVDLDDTLADAIADQCGFKKMKETMNPFGQLGPLGMPPGILQGMLRGIPPGMAQGMLRGMPPGMPPGMSPGMPRGMPPGMGQGMPRGMPPGPPQGVPRGMPPGMPQGMPPSMHPDMSNGMPPGMPEGAEKMVMPNMLRKGVVGDWKNNFTVAQNERFDNKYIAKMGECSFKFRYEL